jgi:hypothetical protein
MPFCVAFFRKRAKILRVIPRNVSLELNGIELLLLRVQGLASGNWAGGLLFLRLPIPCEMEVESTINLRYSPVNFP